MKPYRAGWTHFDQNKGTRKFKFKISTKRLFPTTQCDVTKTSLPVIERLQSLLPLALAQLGGVPNSEECGRKFREPLGVDGGDLPHVFLGGENQFMINDPLGLSVKQSTGRMDVDDLMVYYCTIAFLWVFPGGISEETACDRLLDACCLFSTRYHV